MHNIYDVNRSVAGHFVDYSQNALDINKNSKSFSLPRSDKEISFCIDKILVTPEKNLLKCVVSGWAFINENTAPAKSIYIAYNNKLISRGKPCARMDVRIAMDLTFDQCGFECTFNLPNINTAYHTVTLLIVGNNISHAHHLKLFNVHAIDKIKASLTTLDRTCIRTDTPSFDYKIENAVVADGKISFSGWCFLKENPEADVYINFIKSGVILGDTSIQTISRPEIEHTQESRKGYNFFGFEFTSYPLKELPLVPTDTSIDMLLAAQAYNKKEIIRIYSE